MFWVVGGIHTDMSLKALVPGTLECYGPFQTRDQARVEWEGRSRAKIDICQHRLFITEAEQEGKQ